MTKQSGTVIRYSISFKQKVVREIETEGLTIAQVNRRYGIKGGQTVHNWLRRYGKNHLLNKIIRVETKQEKDRIRELEAENKKLKLALADSTLEKRALEVLIDVVNEHYDTDVKKNLGPRLSKKSGSKGGRS